MVQSQQSNFVLRTGSLPHMPVASGLRTLTTTSSHWFTCLFSHSVAERLVALGADSWVSVGIGEHQRLVLLDIISIVSNIVHSFRQGQISEPGRLRPLVQIFRPGHVL